MNEQPAFTYIQSAAQGASPIGQVIMLYDTILRDFSRAKAAQTAGNVEVRVNQLNHALTVIAHLQSVLDFEQGGEAAKRFERFYDVTRGLIVQTNAQPTPESFEQLISLYGKVRQAWYQADRNLSVRDEDGPLPQERLRGTHSPAAAQIPMDDDAPRRRWSS